MTPTVTNTIKIQKIEDGTIDYNNGIMCDYTCYDDKLTHYNFHADDISSLTLIEKGNIDALINSHWTVHHDVIKCRDISSLSELIMFDDFDNLFYIGGGIDGMLKNHKNEYINTITRLGSSFFSIYQKLEDSEVKVQKYLEQLNFEYIKSSKIEYIPHYNQDTTCSDHYTLNLDVLLPLDLYREVYNNKKGDALNMVVDILKKK